MRLTNSQLEILRKQPQSTKLYLSIFQPQAVFKARINSSSLVKGSRTIPYDTVTLGSYTDIVPNATMWIGSTNGAKDVGKIRVRSATSGFVVVSENDNVDWDDNLFLTVFYYVELWPIFPRIINDPNNEENVIFYKDFDIDYTNQNSILGTFINMGPHRADFRGSQIYYSSTGTHNLRGSALNYNWTFEGGSPSSSSSANPGYVTYNSPGHYVTRLQISGSNGAVDTGYRCVSIYDPIGQGTNTPVQRWEMTSLGGSRDEGGYNANFKVHDEVEIEENYIVVLFSDDWYGSSHQSFGGNFPNASNIFFVGHVLEDSIHYDHKRSYVEFSAGSLTQLMKQSLGFSVSVESVANPDVWYELLDMDCRRALYHYLRWHTTALQIGDFQFVGEDAKIQYFDADRTSMYDAIDNLMRGTLLGKSVSDRQGKTWLEVGAEATPSPTASFPSVMDLTRRDWRNEPTIQERLSDELSYLELGGIAYSGVVTGTFSAIIASAPGNTPSFRGVIENHQGLALLGQDQLSEMVGNVWANRNAPYPKIDMELGINARNLDIAPQETTDVSISASDTVRGVAIDGLYLVNDMSWEYIPRDSLLLPTLSLQSLVDGTDGQKVTIPNVDEVGPGFSVPPIQIPPLPLLTIPATSIPSGTLAVAIQGQISGFVNTYVEAGWHENVYSEDFNKIRVVGADRTPNEIDLDSFDPPGIYYISAQFTVQGTGLSAGFKSANFAITVNGVRQNLIVVTGEADGSGNCTLTGHVHMLTELSSGSIVEITLGGGIGGFNDPYEFSVSAFRISEAA